MYSKTFVGVGLIAAALLLGLPGTMFPENAPDWPSEQEQRLKELDEEMFDVMRQRFAATFGANGRDEKELERLAERLKHIKKERFEMLRATGQM